METATAAVGFALFTSLCFGAQAIVVNAGMKRVKNTVGSPALAASFVTIATSTVVFWVLALSQGVPEGALTVSQLLPFVIVGLAYPALYRYLYFEGIDRVGASLSAAIVAMNPVVATVLAVAVSSEEITAGSVIGIGGIVLGGILLQSARTSSETEPDSVVREFATASMHDILYPVAGMVLLGGAYVLIDYGLTGFPDPVTATAVTQTSALVAFGVGLLLLNRHRDVRDAVGRPDVAGAFIVAGGLVAAGWLGQFFALSVGTVATVVPLVSTYPLVVTLLSYTVVRELPRSPHVFAGIIAIIAGGSLLQVS